MKRLLEVCIIIGLLGAFLHPIMIIILTIGVIGLNIINDKNDSNMNVEELFKTNIEYIKDEVYKDFDRELSMGFFENGDTKDLGVEIDLDDEHFVEVEYRANASWGHSPRTYDSPEEWYGYYHYEIVRVKIYDNDSTLLYDNINPQIEESWND